MPASVAQRSVWHLPLPLVVVQASPSFFPSQAAAPLVWATLHGTEGFVGLGPGPMSATAALESVSDARTRAESVDFFIPQT